MRTIIVLSWILLMIIPQSLVSQSIPTPAQYLGYELGERFTLHYRVMGYMKTVAEASDRVQLQSLGTSYEGREQILVFLSSARNLSKLETIRENNLKRTGLLDGKADSQLPIIVWLSYNVHGNEAVSSEAAMKTLHELATTSDTEKVNWLQHVVVIINPMLNPDGHDRYVTWYHQTKGMQANADPNAREHAYQWASGRTNHYYFDMNRDWAWMTQKETRDRIEQYNRWMPQIHVDFHEQGYNEPYYFAPAAEPVHDAVTPFQRSFQMVIGKNHARYFDEYAWLFFTRQRFDLFYPSYGDSWPMFNGSIGMTYEQGGINAGLQVITETGDTLTLAQRIEHHHITGMSTIESAVNNKVELEKNFTNYFKQSNENPDGEFKTYILKKNNSEAVDAMLDMLQKQGIRYEVAPEGKQVSGFNYFTSSKETYKIQKGDWLISAYQPKSQLVRVLFDPKPFLSDSITYDITSWALPWVFGVETVGVNQKISGTQPVSPIKEKLKSNAAAYILSWDSFTDAKVLSDLFKHNIRVRLTQQPITVSKATFNQGSILVLRADNKEKKPNYESTIEAIAEAHHTTWTPIESGLIEQGVDLGSSDIRYLNAPKVVLLTGVGSSSASVGELWYYFEELLGYPVTLIDAETVGRINFSNYTTVVLPAGNFSKALGETGMEKLKDFIKNGGTVIAVSSATNWLSSVADFGSLNKKNQEVKQERPVPGNYAEKERNYISSSSPGAYFKSTIDASHPLGYGYSGGFFTLKVSESIFEPLKEGWNVATLSAKDHISGFIGSKLKAQLNNHLVVGHESVGRGNVVYFTENVTFRAFLYHNHLVLANALFFMGQTK